MTDQFDLYHGYYGRLGAEAQSAVRRETWDEDVGQSSWITLAEAREWFPRLELGPGRAVLEVACGSGGMTCRMALDTGATCVGLDINANGIEAAKNRALEADLLFAGLVPARGRWTSASVSRRVVRRHLLQ